MDQTNHRTWIFPDTGYELSTEVERTWHFICHPLLTMQE